MKPDLEPDLEIDQSLIARALEASGLETQCEVIEFALKTLIQTKPQEEIKSLRGKLPWNGDLEAMRTDT
jgi:Arc/MetJ family transcription regulator